MYLYINVFQKLKMIRKYESTILKSKLNQIIILGKGSIKIQKKIWIYPYLGGWVVQGGDNFHKKNKKKHAFKIHFRLF